MPRSDTQFKPGAPGRPKGAINKINRTVRETVLRTFEELQKDPKQDMIAFAKKYPRDFYQIAAKLIPQEMVTEIVAKDLPEWLKP
jgi:hypothetical protein